MKKILTCFLILQISFLAYPQRNETSVKTAGETNVQSFDEDWLFKRYGLQADGTRLNEVENLQGMNVLDESWQKVDVPHDWAITGPFRIELEGATGKLPWKGIGWYRKHFIIPATDNDKKIFVDFDGAMANAKIWLNGNYVGTWPYGYSSFRMDLTPYIKFGKENILAVRLNTEDWDSRWYPGAGIYRHVWLVKTNNVHVSHWGTHLTTPEITAASAKINLKVSVDNDSEKDVLAVIKTKIYKIDKNDIIGKQVASCEEAKINIASANEETASVSANISNPELWDINSPDRYVAQTSVIVNGKTVDVYNTVFGVRKLEFTAHNGFLLNGRRVQIQGTCNHHDLGALGAAINYSALYREIKILKEMGCNALRTSHNPPAPELIDIADKLGMLVLDEAFDCWKTGKREKDYNLLFDEWHEKDLKALVHRDRNNPSVFMWSIGNEVPDQQNAGITKMLADIVRAEDATRPVTNGYNDPDGSRASGAAVNVDVMGVNYFFNNQPKWDADTRYANKPTMGSETSSCVTSRGEYYFDGDYNKETWQVSSYDSAHPGWGCYPDVQFRTNVQFPHLLGEFVWTGFDYLGEPTPYNSDETNLLNFRTDPSKQKELAEKLEEIKKNNPPSRSSYFGIVDLAGFPKDRYYLYQSHWHPDLPMVHILPHWNWQERMGMITPVNVYTSGDEAELFLNGKSLGRKKKTEGIDFRLAWDSVIYQPGELKVVAYKNGKQWATDIVKTTGVAAKLFLEAGKRTIKNDGLDLCYITLKIEDKNGLMVPRTNSFIHFSVEGAGEIVATDNGNAIDFTPFQSHDRKAFNGLALVIVKAKKGMKGNIIVKAASDGLGEAKITVKSM